MLKRWAPFDSAIKSVWWLTKVVGFLYAKADLIPQRIQEQVNAEYRTVHDAEWKIKEEKAEEKVKRFAAAEFPEFYRRTFLHPYEEGSELHNENHALLGETWTPTTRKFGDASGLKTRALW